MERAACSPILGQGGLKGNLQGDTGPGGKTENGKKTTGRQDRVLDEERTTKGAMMSQCGPVKGTPVQPDPTVTHPSTRQQSHSGIMPAGYHSLTTVEPSFELLLHPKYQENPALGDTYKCSVPREQSPAGHAAPPGFHLQKKYIEGGNGLRVWNHPQLDPAHRAGKQVGQAYSPK